LTAEARTDRAETLASIRRTERQIAQLQERLRTDAGSPEELGAIPDMIENARTSIGRLRARIDYIDQTGAPPPSATVGSAISDFATMLGRSVVEAPNRLIGGAAGLLGSGLSTVGAEDIGGAISEYGAETEASGQERGRRWFGETSEAARYSPIAALAGDVGAGVGSLTEQLALRGAGRLASGLGAARTAQALGRAQYPAAAAAGSSEMGQDIQQFREEGGEVTSGQEFLARLGGAGLGLTEVGVINRMIERVPVTARQQAIDAVFDVVDRATVGQVAPRAALEAIERAVTNIESRALGRIALTGAEEAGQEAVVQAGQNLLAQQIYDPNQEIMEGVGRSALVGGIVGGGVRGVAEAVQQFVRDDPALIRAVSEERFRLYEEEGNALRAANPNLDEDAIAERLARTATAREALAERNVVTAMRQRDRSRGEVEDIPNNDPEVVQTFRDLARAEVNALMDADPDLQQDTAVNMVVERSGDLLEQAKAQVRAARGVGDVGREAGAGAGATGLRPDDAGLAGPTPGGGLAGVSPDGGAVLSGAALPSVERLDGRPVAEPVSGAPVSPVREGAQFDPLTPIREAANMKERKAAAMQLVSDVTMENPQFQGLLPKQYTAAATRIAQTVARGGDVDPLAVLAEVSGVQPAPTTAVEEELAARDQQVSQELVAPPMEEAPATVAETATVEKVTPEVFEDNPGGEWEARQQQKAERGRAEALAEGETTGSAARMLNGPATQTVRRVEIPVEKLRSLEGINNEQPAPGEPKYDALRKSVDEGGFDREKAGLPMVWVNHNGEAFIAEGNNRVAVAAEEGVTSLPVEVQYMNGGEKVAGPFSPDTLLAEHQNYAPVATEAPAPKPKRTRAKKADPDQGVLFDIGEGGGTDVEALRLVETPSSASIYAFMEQLPEQQRLYAEVELRRAMERYQRAEDIETLLEDLRELRERLLARTEAQREARSRPRVRGFERAMEVTYKAERNMQLSRESAEMVRWLLQKNPAIADDLAFSLRGGNMSSPSGQYDPFSRLATIFTQKAKTGTATHEVLHHTERMMPEKVRDGIRAAWAKRIKDLRAMADATGNVPMREVLATIVSAYYGDPTARKRLQESFAMGDIPYSVYHLSNPSEFWAVNATELVGKRAKRTGWVGEARNWLEGFIEAIKDAFGFTNNSAIIKGLNAVLNAESGEMTGKMLSAKTGTFRDLPDDTGGTQPITTQTVAAAVSRKLTKGQIRRLEEAAGIRRMKINNMQKRILRSRKGEETLSLAGKLSLMARRPNADVGILTSLYNSIAPGAFQKMLGPMMTEDVVRLGTAAGMKNPARIDAMMRDEYLPYINRLMMRATKTAERWADFTSRSEEGGRALGDIMFSATMMDVDPTLADNATAYIAIDPKLKDLEAKLANTTDPKKQKTLRGSITERKNNIKRVYNGGTDPKSGDKVYGWNDLSQKALGSGTGKQLFREVRDHYRADFDEHYRLLMERIDDGDFEEEDATRLKGAVEEMFAEARKRIIYFPLKRYGEYWVSVGKGPEGEFHMFESQSAQKAFMDRLRAEKETRKVTPGFGTNALRGSVANKDASTALKKLLDMVDEGGASTDVNTLKDHIFQMYLTALPEADMRRRFLHRQFKAGFSTDTLRTFATTSVAAANQLGRLAFNHKFQNLIDQSYKETEDNPSKVRLDTITRELEMRIEGTMSPDPENTVEKLLALGAKGTFLYLLSAPKSAIINLTQLHIVGLPTLSAEFGEVATYAMATKYTTGMLTGSRIANPFRDDEGNVTIQMPRVTLENNANMLALKESKKEADQKRYKALQRAWTFAHEHDVTQSTFAASADLYDRSNTPTETYSFTQSVRRGDMISATQRATANTMEAMGAMFHGMERVGREVMFMSAFELAYDRELKKKGVTSENAADIAMRKAAELTNAGMFDFSNWNKSRYAKSQLGRLPLAMRSYSFSMTSLLVRSFVNMLPFFNKEGKAAAARVFFGVAAMTTLYAGIRGSWLYALAMGAYGILQWAMSIGDDEEEELTPEIIERELLKNKLGKKDMEYYIRTTWIPETFGPDGTMATALGLSDESAEMLATAADIGIPGVFGVDISNSVSLNSLWHPVDVKSDDPEVQFYEFISRTFLGPTSALASAAIKTIKEANAGNPRLAIETAMPAVIRNYLKSERLQEEGLVIGKDRDIVLREPEFYDTYTSMMQSLGFAEAESSRDMQLSIAAGDIEREVAAERTDLLNKRYRAVLDITRDPSEENFAALTDIDRSIQIYNLNYPSNAITADTMQRSFQEKAREAAERSGGMGINERIPVRMPLVQERLREEAQE